MTVVVIDRSRATNYDYGPHLTTVTISRHCPICGGKRGEPRWHRFHENGDWHSVNVWDNPCGHVDTYDVVLREAGVRS